MECLKDLLQSVPSKRQETTENSIVRGYSQINEKRRYPWVDNIILESAVLCDYYERDQCIVCRYNFVESEQITPSGRALFAVIAAAKAMMAMIVLTRNIFCSYLVILSGLQTCSKDNARL